MNLKVFIKKRHLLGCFVERSRLKTICSDYTEDEPPLLSKETSPEEKEKKYQQMDVESEESAFQRHRAHHRFISPLTFDV